MSAPLRTVPCYLVCPGDEVDRALLAPYYGFNPDDCGVGRVETVVVGKGRTVLIFTDGEVWGGLEFDDNVSLFVKVAKCPDCGALHDLAQCESEYGGGVSCDCCRAIKKGK